ncbi:resolvase [Nocardia nova]|uniref:Resolvase n=1 Tax=Nocardia nova TaxID=37330 RepID=A0A2S6AVC7_9NOCA|nr:recombinase family protein [Nocardia nova]PPJ19915.1 resolvase [Nocardia nova]PPJ39186.1 resolvase [Nocardia nova]
MRIGYGRVSTRDQHPEAQHDALTAAGCEQIFLDKTSGKLASRPELSKALLVANRPKDQLVVTKLDRLGCSLEHLIELSKTLQDRGVDLVVLDQGIDTSTAVGRMFFQILGAIAEFEHALMSERTRDGLAAARARGRTGGQKPKLGPGRSSWPTISHPPYPSGPRQRRVSVGYPQERANSTVLSTVGVRSARPG